MAQPVKQLPVTSEPHTDSLLLDFQSTFLLAHVSGKAWEVGSVLEPPPPTRETQLELCTSPALAWPSPSHRGHAGSQAAPRQANVSLSIILPFKKINLRNEFYWKLREDDF